jgi:hypothetical protein
VDAGLSWTMITPSIAVVKFLLGDAALLSLSLPLPLPPFPFEWGSRGLPRKFLSYMLTHVSFSEFWVLNSTLY